MRDVGSPIIDYRSPATPPGRARPVRLLSHTRTAAMLCIIAIVLHITFGFRGTRDVVWVELGLVVYGVVAAGVSVGVGGLSRSDKVWLWCRGAVYFLTFAWAILVPSLN